MDEEDALDYGESDAEEPRECSMPFTLHAGSRRGGVSLPTTTACRVEEEKIGVADSQSTTSMGSSSHLPAPLSPPCSFCFSSPNRLWDPSSPFVPHASKFKRKNNHQHQKNTGPGGGVAAGNGGGMGNDDDDEG